ncbi:MAG: hypothetical protein CBC65_000910 [Rhodothermaceae bacterium TMED105]|jgi:hypothetical protein|nr:MAG: hypothetical protein CBC65_000910 [Rhodothermaceae bacterium TMED105]|tara:strand:- start:1376 stop:1909 length:534 start_codon:yes stop_codon:yes gene_type:complete
MSDLSEAFAEMNAERMGDAVRKNTRQNAVPRMFPSSARVGRLGNTDEEDEDVVAVGPGTPKQKRPPSPPPLTPKMKADMIMEHIKDLGVIHDLLHPEELNIIRQSISPGNVIYNRPMECVVGSSIICILVGIAIGMTMKTQRGSEFTGFRSTAGTSSGEVKPSSASKRTVDRMLDYV